jgi:hypothetical protein
MECEPPSPELIAAGDQKISNVIREVMDERFPAHAPHMVLGWHLCVSVMTEDGERHQWNVAQDDARLWDVLGMMEFAKLQVTARVIAGEMEE